MQEFSESKGATANIDAMNTVLIAGILLSVCTLPFLARGGAPVPPTLPVGNNFDFESPVIASSFQYIGNTPEVVWQDTCTKVIIKSGSSPWGGVPSFSGNQYMGMQTFASECRYFQVVSDFTPGHEYCVSYRYRSRPSYPAAGSQLRILQDSDQAVIAQNTSELGTGSWLLRTLCFTATESDLVIEFVADPIVTSTDRTTFIDNVQLTLNE